MRTFRVRWYQAVRLAEEVQTLLELAITFGYTYFYVLCIPSDNIVCYELASGGVNNNSKLGLALTSIYCSSFYEPLVKINIF